MFGLFKKKEPKEAPPQDASPQNDALKQFAARFLPEELSVLAVTDATGFGASREKDSPLWKLQTELTAWMEEDSPDIHQGGFLLTGLADDTLRGYLAQRIRGDFILKFHARVSEDGTQLLLLDLPEPGFDPDLKAILEEQKKPDSTYIEGLGTFVLNRRVKWYETELEWAGRPVQLTFDQEEEQTLCCQTAKALAAKDADWDSRIRSFAAQELLDLANDWAADSTDEGDEPSSQLSQDDFIARMELESIQVYGDGSFDFWFNDGDLFWGHAIHVWGDLNQGPTNAQMEG